jgi:hypothetical protein
MRRLSVEADRVLSGERAGLVLRTPCNKDNQLHHVLTDFETEYPHAKNIGSTNFIGLQCQSKKAISD